MSKFKPGQIFHGTCSKCGDLRENRDAYIPNPSDGLPGFGVCDTCFREFWYGKSYVPGPCETIARELGKLTDKKDAAYGKSFDRCGVVLRELYPNGIQPEHYDNLLAIVRVVDKLFRIATDKDAFGESPWKDVAGYAVLSVRADEERKESKRRHAGREEQVHPREMDLSADALSGVVTGTINSTTTHIRNQNAKD